MLSVENHECSGYTLERDALVLSNMAELCLWLSRHDDGAGERAGTVPSAVEIQAEKKMAAQVSPRGFSGFLQTGATDAKHYKQTETQRKPHES